MPTVISIERRPRGVAAVTIDGGDEPCLLPLEEIIEHRLHEGATLAPEAWEAVRRQGRQRLAVRKGLEVLARRRRTEADLRAALGRHFEEAETESAVNRLRDLGYLDDQVWADDYVASTRSDGRGQRRIRLDLRQHGIADAIAARAVEAHDDVAAAQAAAEKRMRSLARLEPERRRRRLYDFLRRRGFGDDVARRVIAEQLEGSPEAGEAV